MKTVFVTSYNGFISRNILGSDVLRILKTTNDLRIVIFVPPNKSKLLKEYYGNRNTIFIGWDYELIVRTRYNKFWWRLAFLLENSRYVKDQRNEQLYCNRTLGGYLNYIFVSAVASILSRLSIARSLYRWLDYYFSPQHTFHRYFEQYRPDLLFATDIFAEADILVMREARAHGVPFVGMVRSWDNTTTKGILRIVPERIVANGAITKEELIRFHSCSAGRIVVTGLPQFDRWISGPTLPREEFFEEIGADPAKRLLLFAPGGSGLSDTDWQLVTILQKALDEGKLPIDVQFLVRNHPAHPADFSKFSDDPRFIIETPGIRLKQNDYKGMELLPTENDHLRNSVYYSEMIMYVATSLGLDATVFDKPQILISFDGWEKKPYVQSVRRYNREDCLASLVALGGTKVVYSTDEWIAAINAYLKNPKLNQDGRHRTIGRHMYKLDGRAGERIAQAITQQLHGQ